MANKSSVPEPFSSTAVSVVYDDDGRGHIIHGICKTDSLAGLAIKYGVEVMDIKRTNRLIDDRQMFAQKTLRIPLPGPHPPSAVITNSSVPLRNQSHRPPAATGGKTSSPDKGHVEKRALSPAMGLLMGYYGLKSPPRRKEEEGTEMLVYKSDAEIHLEDEPFSPPSPPSNRWALVSPDRKDVLDSAMDQSRQESDITSHNTRWDNVDRGQEGRHCWDFGAMRAQGGDEEEAEGLGNGESAPLLTGVSRPDSFGETAEDFGMRRKVSGRRGRRSSQAEEVAAVVEELARAHRDNFVPVGMAGEVGRVSTEDPQGEKLTRRRTRGDVGGGSVSNSPVRLGEKDGARKSLSDRGGLPVVSRSSRGDIPGRGPKPKPEIPVENIAQFSLGSGTSFSTNGWHYMESRGEITSKWGCSEDETSTNREGRSTDSGLEELGSSIKKSVSSPLLKGSGPQTVRVVSGPSNLTTSFSSPVSYEATTAHKNTDKNGGGGLKGVSLRRNGSKAAMD